MITTTHLYFKDKKSICVYNTSSGAVANSCSNNNADQNSSHIYINLRRNINI